MQSLLMAASAAALLHSTMVSSGPLIPDGPPTGPMPQNGVWALLPTDCAAPTSLDMSTWAKCAVPVGFLDDVVAALEKPGPGKKATADEFYSVARTKFTIAAPAPLPVLDPKAAPAPVQGPAVAQVVVPMVFSRSYYYIAIQPKALDETGHFAEATGWPVACQPEGLGGCTAKTLADVQSQAMFQPMDPQRLYRLVRVLPSDTPPPGPDEERSKPAVRVPGAVTEAPLPPPTPAPSPS